MELPLNALTPRMRNVLIAASRHASTHGQGYIGTEHVLLALAQDDSGVAGQALANLGMAAEIVAAMEDAIDRNGARGEAGNDDDAAVVAFDPEPNYPLRVRL